MGTLATTVAGFILIFVVEEGKYSKVIFPCSCFYLLYSNTTQPQNDNEKLYRSVPFNIFN